MGDMNEGQTIAYGFEGQRCPDLGNGFYKNPVVPGDHADPTILKDGSDYYMTFSSFQASPGVIVWHSRDLVNWVPLCAALNEPLGSVWAMDFVKHNGRYFIYIPVLPPQGGSKIYVIHADNVAGPWSAPVDLGLEGCIDPGHALGEDGRRWLFVNGIRRIALADDGLSVIGSLEKVYEPWQYPQDWVVEMFAPEGPKLFRRGEWFYLVSAVGGTAGPATSHMVIVARSRSIDGPWVDCPDNPIVRTKSAAEPWWSRGHASLVEGPSGDWWMVSHAYENGFRTLGRQTLLEPIEWTDDGWPRSLGGDLSTPLPKPAGGATGPSGFAFSDDFSQSRLGLQWTQFGGGPDEGSRLQLAAGPGGRGLAMAARGSQPANSAPLCMLAVDRDYECEVSISCAPAGNRDGVADVGESGHPGVCGALLLYYNERMFCGVGFTGHALRTWHYGEEHVWVDLPVEAKRLRLKLQLRDQVATWWYAVDEDGSLVRDGEPCRQLAWRRQLCWRRQLAWRRHPWQMEVSGMNHNVFGGFTALKIALASMGTGAVRFEDFRYRGPGEMV